ncbi:MAG TPA: oligosaccharide flippase family protein [Desulfatiglandales bacterium]|nr:oligosaccharide flippase family protein [Desulfatiglandales bacterium]
MSENISPGRHMMTGTIRIFLAEALILPTGFITAVFLARYLGPVGYGMFALVSRLIVWVEWTSITGFSGTTIKFVGETPDWRPIGSSVIHLHFIIGIGTSILLWLFAPPISALFDEPEISGYIRLFAVEIPVLSLASACSYILVGTGRYREVSLIRVLRLMARLVLIILLVGMGLSVKGAIIGSIGASVIELIISWFYTRPVLFSKDAFPIRRLLDFGVPLFISELCQRIFRLDLFALKALGGTAAQAGFYGAAMNLTIPPIMFSKSLSYPLLSTLSSLIGNGDGSRAREIARTSMRSILWLMPFAAMTAGASREIVILIFGERYLATSPILAFLIFAVIAMLAVNLSKTILTAIGKPGLVFIITGPMVPVALIGHLILIPIMGGTGAAIVTASVACLGAFVSLFIIYRIWNISLPLKSIIKGLACSILAFAIASLWPAAGLMLILKLISIMLFILLFFLFTGEFTRDEIRMFRSIIRFP